MYAPLPPDFAMNQFSDGSAMVSTVAVCGAICAFANGANSVRQEAKDVMTRIIIILCCR